MGRISSAITRVADYVWEILIVIALVQCWFKPSDKVESQAIQVLLLAVLVLILNARKLRKKIETLETSK